MKFLQCLIVVIAFLNKASCFSFSPIIAPRSGFVKNLACQKQSSAYVDSVKNFTLWAVEMYDSSAKLPNGILAANSYQLGNFDQCLRVHADLGINHGGRVDGKYCLVKVELGAGLPSSPLRSSPHFDPFESAWEKIRFQPQGVPILWERDQIHWGICVPAVCNPDDIQAEIQHVFRTRFDGNITATIDASHCQTSASIKEGGSSLLDMFSWTLFSTIFLLVIVGTIYDVRLENKKMKKSPRRSFRNFFMCFSLRQNVQEALNPKLYNNGFDYITSWRTFLSLMVIYTHRWRINMISPLPDSTIYEKTLQGFVLMTTCVIFLNAFIVISGFLSGYFFYAKLLAEKKVGRLNPRIILSSTLDRFLRFTPSLLIVILLNLTLLPRLSNGPIWPQTVLQDVRKCEDNWWTNLLYINNYYSADRSCLFQTWYLAADMHLFILARVVLYIYVRSKLFGQSLLGILVAAPLIWQAILMYTRNDFPFFFPSHQSMHRMPNDYFFLTYYIPTHFRIPTYFMAVFLGMKTWDWRNSSTSISKKMADVYNLSLAVLMVLINVLGHCFVTSPSMIDLKVIKALYGALHGPCWALLFCLTIVIVIRRPGGYVQGFFTMRPLIYVSKLSYGGYLLHTLSHSAELGSTRIPKTASCYFKHWMTAGDIFFVYCFAFLLYIFIEAPFAKLRKFLPLGDWEGRRKKENTD